MGCLSSMPCQMKFMQKGELVIIIHCCYVCTCSSLGLQCQEKARALISSSLTVLSEMQLEVGSLILRFVSIVLAKTLLGPPCCLRKHDLALCTVFKSYHLEFQECPSHLPNLANKYNKTRKVFHNAMVFCLHSVNIVLYVPQMVLLV